MTIGNALAFIERGQADGALRGRLNAATSCKERDDLLAAEQMVFSDHDFDEACRHRLTQCQEAEEAEQLKEFKMWWDLLSRILEPSGCGSQCSGCSH